MAAQRRRNRTAQYVSNDRAARRRYEASRSNLAYDYNALERQRVEERPERRPPVRTLRRADVHLRAAERVSLVTVAGFLVAGVLLALVLVSYVRLTALSDSVVSLQAELETLETENVTLTTAYERAFDLETVESAATAAGMSKPSSSQVYYLDSDLPDSASVYTTESGGGAKAVLAAVWDKLRAAADFFT